MRSKILVCLFAVVIASVGGVFAAELESALSPVVSAPAPVEDFLGALANADPSKPIDTIVVSCSPCVDNASCATPCGNAGYCGGRCRTGTSCGSWKVCDCLFCP